MKKVFSFFLILLSLFFVFSFQIKTPVLASDLQCTQYILPVTLSSTDPTIYHVFGQLCSQGGIQGKTVQLLVHGFSYDHNYWMWPQSPEKYSYVRKAADEGYATFTIDRIGIGKSDHPLSTLVTVDSNAFVVHQIIQDLRKKLIGSVSFSKVILVGHSFGSIVALFEQSIFSDADGIILSGLLHQSNPADTALGSDIYPASQDPKFVNANFPGLYLTTVPETRGTLFYNLADADPQVIVLDELLKQTGTDGESSTSTSALSPTISQAIHVPVLVTVGQFDSIFCNSNASLLCDTKQEILQREQPNYSSHACLEAFVLPNSGHDLNLHLNAHEWFEAANVWANRRIGNSVNNPPTQPCQ